MKYPLNHEIHHPHRHPLVNANQSKLFMHYKILRQVNWKRVLLHFSCYTLCAFLLIYCRIVVSIWVELIIKSLCVVGWRQQQSAHSLALAYFSVHRCSPLHRPNSCNSFYICPAALRRLVFKTTIIIKSRQPSVQYRSLMKVILTDCTLTTIPN